MDAEPKGPEAARLRKRKLEVVRELRIPKDALPGSFALTHRRCGKPTCHCAMDEGHPLWSLTFMANGRKRVERIPDKWIDEVRRRVERGRRFKEALTEALTANALLLVLARKQSRR